MLWIILTLALIINSVIIGYWSEESIGFGVLGGIIGLLGGILISLISIAIIGCCNYPTNCPEKYNCEELYEENNICALQDDINNEINSSGAFFLGCGSLVIGGESDLYYGYFIETDKGKVYKRAKASNVYVQEIEDGQPRIITHTKNIYTAKSKFMRKWLFCDEYKINVNESTLYIPKGTIKYDYNIDLQ